MRSGFFRRHKHKVFEYTPRHFDPEKEEREKRIKALEEKYSGKRNDVESIKERISMTFHRDTRSEKRRPIMIRLFVLILILTLIYGFFIQ